MGRTRRKRANKKSPQSLDHEENVINLRKFLSRNGFNDEVDLKLRNFPLTGRGVACMKNLHENDILINIPYDLMITYATLKSANFLRCFTPSSKLTIHDLLTTFLILEKHKRNYSFWKNYINSLPSNHPWLPALLSEQHSELLPFDLRLATKKSRRLLQESWSRVKGSINKGSSCSCCGKGVDCVIDLHSFTWGFILVNTRAVYVDPKLVGGGGDILSDEPCMALCPFLDMFNHSDKARCRAELVYEDGGLFYQLTTLTNFKKYEQVFISYGSHDNVKLLVEYGFFIPGNCNDCISFQSEEVFKVLELDLGDGQYKFINRHDLNRHLSIGESGPSFNLKGFLFVASRDASEIRNFASVVYTDNYPEEFLKNEIKNMCRKLLLHKMEKVEENLRTLEVLEVNSIIIDFLKCRCDFIKKLCEI